MWYDNTSTRWRIVEASAGLASVISGTHEFSGAISFTGGLASSDNTDIGGVLKFSSPATPTALAAGTTNDYTVGGSLGSRNLFRLTPDAAGSLVTGFSGGATNLFCRMFNIGTGTAELTLGHQNAGSTAANRIICPGEVDFIVLPGDSFCVWYDGSTSRYRVSR